MTAPVPNVFRRTCPRPTVYTETRIPPALAQELHLRPIHEEPRRYYGSLGTWVVVAAFTVLVWGGAALGLVWLLERRP